MRRPPDLCDWHLSACISEERPKSSTGRKRSLMTLVLSALCPSPTSTAVGSRTPRERVTLPPLHRVGN